MKYVYSLYFTRMYSVNQVNVSWNQNKWTMLPV